jgi:hypothetical protein
MCKRWWIRRLEILLMVVSLVILGSVLFRRRFLRLRLLRIFRLGWVLGIRGLGRWRRVSRSGQMVLNDRAGLLSVGRMSAGRFLLRNPPVRTYMRMLVRGGSAIWVTKAQTRLTGTRSTTTGA